MINKPQDVQVVNNLQCLSKKSHAAIGGESMYSKILLWKLHAQKESLHKYKNHIFRYMFIGRKIKKVNNASVFPVMLDLKLVLLYTFWFMKKLTRMISSSGFSSSRSICLYFKCCICEILLHVTPFLTLKLPLLIGKALIFIEAHRK